MSLYDLMRYRRTTRVYTPTEVEDDKLQRVLQAGLYAPSGSNKSPYKIVVIRDPRLKQRIREAAEAVEQEFYAKKKRASVNSEQEFLEWASKKNIRAEKPFLTDAPILLSVSENKLWADRHSKESTWLTIAYMVIAAANEGLSTVTYTPEPHDFMKEILGLEDHFQPQVILPLGYGSDQSKREPNRPSISERVEFR